MEIGNSKVEIGERERLCVRVLSRGWAMGSGPSLVKMRGRAGKSRSLTFVRDDSLVVGWGIGEPRRLWWLGREVGSQGPGEQEKAGKSRSLTFVRDDSLMVGVRDDSHARRWWGRKSGASEVEVEEMRAGGIA